MAKSKEQSAIDTVYKNAEKAIAGADVLLASIGEAVIATDEYGKVTKLNQAALDLLGYEEQDLLHKSYMKVISAYSIDHKPIRRLSRPILRSLIDGKTVTDTIRYKRKDGSTFPAAITVSPVILNKKPIGTVQVFRNITREIEIDRAKTEFVSLASHQLRTPLTSMRWYLELMLDGHMGEFPPTIRTGLQEVHAVNINMIELVGALLSVARIEAGSLSVTPVPMDIAQLARQAVIGLKPQIVEKDIRLTETYDSNLPLLPLDPDLGIIIFQNLLSNAVKYTPSGGTIGLHIEMQKKSVLITVRDSGYGIPKHQQHMLFTKLFRADNARQQDTDGTGLGLYIVKSIIEDSSGRVWFESEENNGSTFYVRLPASGMKARKNKKATKPPKILP